MYVIIRICPDKNEYEKGTLILLIFAAIKKTSLEVMNTRGIRRNFKSREVIV